MVVKIYEEIERFPREERYGLSDQIKKASVSIPSNIAEDSWSHTLYENVNRRELVEVIWLKVVEYVTPFNDYNLALTFAEKDLRDNWQKYREQYLKEIEKNDWTGSIFKKLNFKHGVW